MAILGRRKKPDRSYTNLTGNSCERSESISVPYQLPIAKSWLQALYDTEWVENVWEYTMSEMLDPTIGDEWYV